MSWFENTFSVTLKSSAALFIILGTSNFYLQLPSVSVIIYVQGKHI